MADFVLTNKPATLQQWLMRSLVLMALCFVFEVVVWLVFDPASIDRGEADSGARMFLVLLANVGITVVLARQMVFFDPLYQQAAKTSTWKRKLSYISYWFLLLVLTGIWVTADVVLLLVWLFVAADDGRSWFGLLTTGRVAWA